MPECAAFHFQTLETNLGWENVLSAKHGCGDTENGLNYDLSR
jgi:hypothetical protein